MSNNEIAEMDEHKKALHVALIRVLRTIATEWEKWLYRKS